MSPPNPDQKEEVPAPGLKKVSHEEDQSPDLAVTAQPTSPSAYKSTMTQKFETKLANIHPDPAINKLIHILMKEAKNR